MLRSTVRSAPPLGIIVMCNQQGLNMLGEPQVIKASRAKGCPAWNAVDQRIGSCRLEAFGDGQGRGRRPALPCPLPRPAQHHFGRADACLPVEEYALNGNEPSSLSHRHQEGGQKLGSGLWQIGTARMKAQVWRDVVEMAKNKIAFGKGAANILGLAP